METLKKISKRNWSLEIPDKASNEQIILGATLRIADSLEVMSKNYLHLLQEIERLNKRNTQLQDQVCDLIKQLNAEKSVKSRYFNKLKHLENENNN